MHLNVIISNLRNVHANRKLWRQKESSVGKTGCFATFRSDAHNERVTFLEHFVIVFEHFFCTMMKFFNASALHSQEPLTVDLLLAGFPLSK